MNCIEYSKRALAVAGALNHKDTVAHAALGLSSEVAELLEEVNTLRAKGFQENSQANFKKETGDILWYTNQMLDAIGHTFGDLSTACFCLNNRHVQGTGFVEISDNLVKELVLQVGHVADHAKRLILTGKEVPVPEMLSNLAHIWHALSSLNHIVGTTWEEVFDANIEKLESRYPKGKFTVVGSESHRSAANDGVDGEMA